MDCIKKNCSQFVQSMSKILFLLLFMFYFLLPDAASQNILKISDAGWRLWPDTSAKWENDKLYLPDEVNLKKIKIHPPTGGWDTLNPEKGIQITLPSTVEEHYWGEFGFRDYHNEYYFERRDDQAKNGSYKGVSWWWKEVEIPKSFEGKIAILHIRGARLRAEVYMNRKLVGYHIITETAFTCDVTKAIIPRKKNMLAIRITNPGGRFDWLDTKLMSWNDYQFHASHGFGGLDRGIYISFHDPVYFKDVWILNTPDTNTIKANAIIKNEWEDRLSTTLRMKVLFPKKENPIIKEIQKKIVLPAQESLHIEEEINCPNANLWTLNDPDLYKLEASIESAQGNSKHKFMDTCQKEFGFRWFDVEGIGKDAVLRLNGNRIRLVSAISWGFWGFNGLWPRPALAKKEVQAARDLGLNCLQFHRNIGKADVLKAQDQLGLLRFMEPGGGQTALGQEYSLYSESPKDVIDTSGKDGNPKTFAEKYMEEKIIRMIRDHRSHPSLIVYCIQNEIHPDLNNPRIFHLLRKMHQEDPSRIILLKSGIPPRNQAWMRTYENTIYHDEGNGYSGWWDQHTVGGPGVWQDDMYKNPDKFTHISEKDDEAVMWGEMLGAAVPDNHLKMIRQIDEKGGTSYDLRDHKEILAAYNQFLTKWKFLKAFPSAETLFMEIGNKCYDFWGRVIESAKLAESNDYLVISGWESTAIENHSGLVDNLRNFKGDPSLVNDRLKPIHPVIKARHLVVSKGARDTLDLFLLNESNAAAGNSAKLEINDPIGERIVEFQFSVPEWEKDRFVYPIAEKIVTPPLNQEGFYTATLKVGHDQLYESTDKIFIVDESTVKKEIDKIGIVSKDPAYIPVLNDFLEIKGEPYQRNKQYDVIIATTRLLYGWRSIVDSATEIKNTDDDKLFHTESWGYAKNLEYIFQGLPKGKATITLRFAEVTLNKPGARIFDVAINGKTVLDDFDIYKTTGGKNIAIDKIFTVNVPNGVVKITIPERKVNYAKFSAFKIEAADTVIAINCGGPPYRDENGLLWDRYAADINLTDELLNQTKQGTPLLLLPEGEEATQAYAKKLAETGAFEYLGHVGNVRASWMGGWFFVRENPIFNGLPVNCAMKSYYQTSVSGSDGVLLDGNDVKVYVGYGRDHDRNIGAAFFTCKLKKGSIIFNCLPSMLAGIQNKNKGMHPVFIKRLLINSINYLGIR